MIKKFKKGFTLVELVVVIAVVAILAAVSVVAYVGITRNAKETKDKMVIDQINKSLETSQIVDEKPTVHEIVERFVAQEGYDVREISPEIDGVRIVYSYKNAKFGYWNISKKEVSYPDDIKGLKNTNDLWFFEDEAIDEYKDSYSHYLKSAGSVTAITTNGGLDVGKCSSIKSISLVRSTAATEKIVIHTNSAATSLTINAPEDVVKHYGSVGSLNIIAVKGSSYHEYGKVGFAEIQTGRIALEKGSEVSNIHLNATGSGESAHFDNITIAKDESVEMPEFTRDPIEIPQNGAKIVALQESTADSADKDYVWLTAVGVYEQVTLGTESAAGTTYAAESGNATQKEAAAQIANNITFSEGGQEYKVTATKSGDTWTYEVKTSAGEATTYTAEISSNEIIVKDSEETVVETKNESVVTEKQKEDKKAEAIDVLAGEEIAEQNQQGANYVARIGTKGYETFMAAVAAVKPGETIAVLGDIIVDSTIGSYDYSTVTGLDNKVVIECDSNVTLTFKNSAKFYMTNNGSFILNGHTLNVVFDSSCDPNEISGFVDCTLDKAYKGLHSEYWECAVENKIASVFVDFYGDESIVHLSSGLTYTNQKFLIGGASSEDNIPYDEEVANKVYINNELQPGSGQWSPNLDEKGQVARVYLGSGAQSYVWKVIAGRDGDSETEDLVILENHESWVVVKGVRNSEGGLNGAPTTLRATVTLQNGDVYVYEWWFDVTGGNGGFAPFPEGWDFDF